MRELQQDELAIEVTPAPCQAFCGRVEAVVSDDGAGTVWLVTSSHAITVEWPHDTAAEELPRKGEPVFYNKDLDVVGFGQRDGQRMFSVARSAWGIEGSQHGVLVLSVISILMLFVSFALLANAYLHVVTSRPLESQFACVSVAMASVAALLQWKLVIPQWTSRPMIGIAPRPDVAIEA